MKTALVLVFVVFCTFSAPSVAEDKEEAKPPGTVFPPNQFNTEQPMPNITTTTPKTTTIKPNTTTTTPKTTTIKPNTTTTTPKTTTIKPNTTTTTPKTTTIKPNTTTTPKTSTPAPPPPPQPTPSTNLTVGNYNVTVNKAVCLKATMALQIKVVQPKFNGTFIIQPKVTQASGSCGDTNANLTLKFKEGTVTFLFTKNKDKTSSYVNSVSFNFTYAFVKGNEQIFSAKNDSLELFSAKTGRCYSCRGTEHIVLQNGLSLEVSQDQFQAFNLTKSQEFGVADRCPADQPNYKVAIGVGVTLLVLIIIVVVAYLVTRKRRTDGYQAL